MNAWIIETLIATSLLMGAVLFLREPVARRFGAAAAYMLWLAPALRMVLPPLPASWFGTDTPVIVQAAAPVETLGPIVQASAGPDLWLIALAVWLGGAVMFFAVHAIRYIRFADSARANALWLYAEGPVEIASSPEVHAPVAFGVLGKTVMLPADFASRYDETEQRLALAHEVAHHRRHDIAANMGALAMLSLHWFNPIAHMAHRAFRTDQEAACDARVLSGASPEERHAYGTALFKSATGRVPLAACATGVKATLKLRLRRIALGEKGRQTVSAGLAAVSMLVLMGLAVTATRGVVALDTQASEFQHVAAAAPQKWTMTLADASAAPASIAVEIDVDASREPSAAPEGKLRQLEQAAERSAALAESLADKAEALADAAFIKADAAANLAEVEAVRAAQLANHAEKMAREAEVVSERAELIASQADRATYMLSNACQSAASRQVMTQVENGTRVVVITCDDVVQMRTNAVTRDALTRTRARIEQMPNLSPEHRALVIEGVDKAIARLTQATES